MKLNFWQWLGVALLVIGVTLIIIRETGEKNAAPVPSNPTPTGTQPAAPA